MVKTLTSQAYEYLHNKIVSCEYLPRQELNERQLLEETSFGRTSLREALLVPQSESLIEILPRKGMWITAFTEKSIDGLYQTRKLTGPTVCRKYITLYSKSRLLEFQKMFERAEDASDVEGHHIGTSFHPYLISITDNNILINTCHSIMIHRMRMAVYAAMQDSSNRMGNLKQHKAIIGALLHGSEEDVQNAIVLHINHSPTKSLKLLRNSDRQT